VSIDRRLLKWRLKVSRWREALAEAVTHAAQSVRIRAVAADADVATLAEAREHANQATVCWDQIIGQTREKADLVASEKQTRRENRVTQLRKRTCCVCAKTAPNSSRAIPHCGGCRGLTPRVLIPRYCSEACERANWTDGHNRICPKAHLKSAG